MWKMILMSMLLITKSQYQEINTFQPAIVRVNTDDGNSSSHGTGTCIGSTFQEALILTAWHVVKDNKGQVTVEFWLPNKLISQRFNATVIATNKTWDLAALVVKCSSNNRLPYIQLGNRIPKQGDLITIAGYGKFSYREVRGIVQGFLSPTQNDARDLFAINVAARSGDSGGPMIDESGILVGVLFGSDAIGAHGSHCKRVRWFLLNQVRVKKPKLIDRVLNMYIFYGNIKNYP